MIVGQGEADTAEGRVQGTRVSSLTLCPEQVWCQRDVPVGLQLQMLPLGMAETQQAAGSSLEKSCQGRHCPGEPWLAGHKPLSPRHGWEGGQLE